MTGPSDGRCQRTRQRGGWRAWLVPAISSATVWFAVWVSRSTVIGWRARVTGTCGPAACQVPPYVSAKMPAVPGREHAPAISGTAECV